MPSDKAMAQQQPVRAPDSYGPGTHTDNIFIPVPDEAGRLLRLLAGQTPLFGQDEELLSKTRFTGLPYPVLPGPIKSAAVAAAVHAMIGLVSNQLRTLRGCANPDGRVIIDVTHTALWLATAGLAYLGGEALSSIPLSRLRAALPDWEGRWHSTCLRRRATGIYKAGTPADTWFSLHGSLEAAPMLASVLNIDAEGPGAESLPLASTRIAAAVGNADAHDLECRCVAGGFCGSVCYTPQQWAESPMGIALASHPLIDISAAPATPTSSGSHLPPIPLPSLTGQPDTRPLRGIRVLELTRVIAGPQAGALLASLGADVVRISAPHLRDLNALQLTLNAGKRTVALDLRDQDDRAYAHTLLKEADIVLLGFRPGRLDQFGFSKEDILRVAVERQRGIIYVDESCYGPSGPYAERPGWQQVADAAAGSAYVMGRSLGLEQGECVLPPLPISDMTAGAVAVAGALIALRERTVRGGSYVVRASLVRANTFALHKDVGLYSREVVAECQQRFAWEEMRAGHHVLDLLGIVRRGWERNEAVAAYLVEDSGWFQRWEESAFGNGLSLAVLKPVVRFSAVMEGQEEDDVAATPRWSSPSVPHGYHRKEEVEFGA